MSLTSCDPYLDDIFGEWSRPTPGSSTGGAVTSIGLDADKMELTAGDKGQLTAKVDPAGTAVTWSSDKEAIATVDANGLVTAVTVGTAIITAKAGDKTATCEVTVLPTLSTALTVEAITAGKITVTNPKSGMQYSLNGGAKTAVSGDINVAAGEKVEFYGNGTSITSYDGTSIVGDGDGFKCKVYGNIMSLVDEEGFADNKELTADNTFKDLFKDNIKLTDISGLLLPATTLAASCYQNLFRGCTGLTTLPEKLLPATTLAAACYQNMFQGCTGLTTLPEKLLPATTLTDQCYQNMFQGCTGLTTLPEKLLPATNLALACYSHMFHGCTGLTTAPALPATDLANNCYGMMFYNCSSLTTAPKLPATTLASQCYYGMFENCTSLTTAYVKAAYTNLNDECDRMFNGCTDASTSTFYSDDAANWKSNFSALSSWQTAGYPTE